MEFKSVAKNCIKHFGNHPELALSLSRGFEHYLSLNLQNQGIKIGERIATGGFGIVYQATSLDKERRDLCIKIAHRLILQGKRIVVDGLDKEISVLKKIHMPLYEESYSDEL